MKRLQALALAVAAGAVALVSTADIAAAARPDHHHYSRSDGGPFAAGTFLGFGLGAAAGRSAYPIQPQVGLGYGGVWEQHVQWCESNHAIYERSINSFLAPDGRTWLTCRSPYF